MEKDKIEIGEYIRTDRGYITRIESLEPEEIIMLDKEVWTETDNYEPSPFIYKREIKKHSKNIRDLIEVGDYINGHKVTKINAPVLNKLEVEAEAFIGKHFPEEIKSIVTKEQFEEMEYRV